jgi:NADH-quinone oxidoreductase subunit F
MKTVIRTAETHPLTWRLRDDKQPVWLDEYQSKNGYAGARKALAAWRRMTSSTRKTLA